MANPFEDYLKRNEAVQNTKQGMLEYAGSQKRESMDTIFNNKENELLQLTVPQPTVETPAIVNDIPVTDNQGNLVQPEQPTPANQFSEYLTGMPANTFDSVYGTDSTDLKRVNALQEAETNRMDNIPYNLGEAAGDVANAATVWAGQTGRMGLGLVDMLDRTANEVLRDVASVIDGGEDAVIDALGYGGLDQTKDGATQKLAQWVEDRKENYSDVAQFQQKRQEMDNEESKKLREKESKDRINSGMNAGFSEAINQAQQFFDTLGNYTDNPVAALTDTAESAPDLFTAGAVGKIALKTTVKGITQNLGKEKAAEYLATEVGKKELMKASEKAALGYIGLTEGFSNADQARDEIFKMSHEDLMKNSEAYRDFIDAGNSPEIAKQRVIGLATDKTALIAGASGMLVSKLTGAANFEGNALNRGSLQGVRAKVGGIVKEGTEELGQGVTGQFASNVGVQTADKNKSLTDGLGQSGAQGLIAGLGMGATVSGAHAIPVIGSGAQNTVTAGMNVVANQLNKRAGEAGTKRQEKQATELNEAAKQAQQFVPEENKVSEPVPVDSLVHTEKAKETFKNLDINTDAPADVLTRVINGIKSSENDATTKRDMIIAGKIAVDTYQAYVDAYTDAYNSATDDAQKAQYQAGIDAFSQIMASPLVDFINKSFSGMSLSEAAITKVAEEVNTKMDAGDFTPETYKSVIPILQQVNLDATKVPASIIDKLLTHADAIKLTPAQVQQLKIASQMKKNTEGVSNDVLNGSDGFTGINEYQQRTISALNSGNLPVALQQVNRLGRFADHMQTKADTFESVMNSMQSGDQPVVVTNPITGESYRSLDGSAMTAHPVRSKKLLESMKNDAQAVVNAYASLKSIYGDAEKQSKQATVKPTEFAPATEQAEIKTAPDAVQEETAVPAKEEETQTAEPVAETENEIATLTDEGTKTDIKVSEKVMQEIPAETVVPETKANAKMSDIDKKYLATNQVKKWFKPQNKNFAFNTENFGQKLSEALNSANPLTDVRELVKNHIDPLKVTEHEISVLKEYEDFKTKFSKTFFDNVDSLPKEGERIYWSSNPTQYFSVPREINGETVYAPAQHVIDSMALNALRWFGQSAPLVKYNDSRAVMDILGLDNKTEPTAEQWEALGEIGTDRNNILSDLSRDIMKTLAISPDVNAPQSVVDAVSKGIAVDAYNTLVNMDMFKITNISNSELESLGSTLVNEDNRKNTRVFVNVADNQTVNDIITLLKDSNDILGELAVPEREKKTAAFNEPVRYTNNNIHNGVFQKAPELLAKSRRKASEQHHVVNTELNSFLFDIMGEPFVENMLGIKPIEGLNKEHEKSVEGYNRTVANDIERWHTGWNRMNNAGIDPATAKVRFAYNLGVNYRLNLSSADWNPQTTKLHRELVTVPPSQVEVGNTEHERFFNLAVAQSLGIKVDKQSVETSEKQLADKLATDFKPALNAIKYILNDGQADDAIRQTILKAVELGGEKTKSMHGLYAQARYDLAKQSGQTFVPINLTLELDGITNGPFNAIIQLGLNDLSQNQLNLLKKGGMFFGEEGQLYNSFKEANKGFTDLYEDTSIVSQQALTAFYDKVNQLPKWKSEVAKMVGTKNKYMLESDIAQVEHEASIIRAASHFVGDITLTQNENAGTDVNIKRGLLKNPITVTVYSGSPTAINNKIAKGIIDTFYEKLSDLNLQYKNAVSVNQKKMILSELQNMVQAINPLTVFKTKSFEVGTPVKITKVSEFSFTPEQIRAVRINVSMGLGKYVNRAIKDKFGTIIKRANMMVYASNLMHEIFLQKFNERVEEKTKELREAGELSKYEDLSRKQVEDIFFELSEYAPIFNSVLTANNTDTAKNSQGIYLGEMGFEENSTSKNVESMTKVNGKKAVTRTEAITFTDPGVRAMPLLVQSMEASMQAVARMENPHTALNVFDGYEAPITGMTESSHAINNGVINSWANFDLLSDFFSKFDKGTQVDFNNLNLSDAAIARLEKSYKKVQKNENLTNPVDPAFIAEFKKDLQYEAARVKALKDGLFKSGIPSSIDQMTGSGVVNNHVAGKASEIITDSMTPLEKWMHSVNLPVEPNRTTNRVVSAPDNVLNEMVKALGATDANGLTSVNADAINRIVSLRTSKEPTQQNKINRYVLGKIMPLISADTVIQFGSIDKISDHLRKEYPDLFSNLSFDGNAVTIGNNIFVANPSIETVTHELIHAGTQQAIQDYYTAPEKMPKHARNSISNLESLMQEFMADTKVDKTNESQQVINLIEDHLSNGEKFEALSEFVAWGLTNQHMQDSLSSNKSSGKLTKFISRIYDAIKSLFAIGSDTRINSYFTKLLGNTVSLVDSVKASKESESATPLYQQNADAVNNMTANAMYDRLSDGNSSIEHLNHLNNVFQNVTNGIYDLVKQRGKPIEGIETFEDTLLLNNLSPEVDTSADSFIAHGFNMSEKEMLVFKMMQVSLKAGLDEFGFKTVEANRLYETAKRAVTPEMFLDNPDINNVMTMGLAKAKYDAVFGNSAVKADASGKSNRLANFLALAATNEQFRNILDNLAGYQPKKSEPVGLKENIEYYVGLVMSKVSGLAGKSGVSGTIGSRLDKLNRNLSHFDAESRQSILNKIEDKAAELAQPYEDKIQGVRDTIADAMLKGAASDKLNKYVKIAVAPTAAVAASIASEQAAGAVREGVSNFINNLYDKKLGAFGELVQEMLGTNDANKVIHDMKDHTAMVQEKARQVLREEVPEIIESQYVSLDKESKQAIQRSVINSDMSYLYANGYDMTKLKTLVEDNAALTKEIKDIEAKIDAIQPDTEIATFYKKSALGLGQQIVTGVSPMPYQLPNARSIAHVIGTGKSVANVNIPVAAAPLIDTLASLYAIQKTDSVSKNKLLEVMNQEMSKDPENNGLTFTMNYYNMLKKEEVSKLDVDGSFAAPKGYSPSLGNPNKKVVIAPLSQRSDLIAKGYVMGNQVARDPSDFNREPMYYYQSNEGANPRWVSGVMSTLRHTIAGVDPYAGQTINGVNTVSYTGSQAAKMTEAKRNAMQSMFDSNVAVPVEGNYMQPMVDRNGAVVSYSYQMDFANRDARLETSNDFAENMGAWEGRILEESMADKFNATLVDVLKATYEKDMKEGKADQYIEVSGKSSDPQIREIYRLMPPEMKNHIKKQIVSGKLFIRKDLLNNALGYRMPSVTELWNKNSEELNAFQRVFKDVASNILGDKAAVYLSRGERGWKEFVSNAKDWIVVRSVVVSAANIISNMVHLATVGVSPIQMAKDISLATVAAEDFRKNEREIIRLSHLIQLGQNPSEQGKYKSRLSELRDKQARNPLAPLIAEGLLPAISEKFDTDDFGYKGQLMKKLEGITSKIPTGISNVGKNILITKDSATYAVLNKSIQYGDFVAKYSLYKKLTTQRNPLSHEQALTRVKDEFVNYNILPSRTRSYLEAIGATWFLNYKIRIQKILIRTLRENPIKVLMMLSGINSVPNIFDANAITGSFSYNLGFGNMFNGITAHPLWGAGGDLVRIIR